MEQQRHVVMMDVVVLVELVHLAKSVVVDPVLALPTVPEDNVGMMVAEEHLVENVRLLKLAQTDFVLEPPLLTVPEDNVETTEQVAIVVSVVRDNAAELVNVSVIMTVTTETVELPFNLREPTLDCALKDHAVLVPRASLAVPPEDVQP